MLSAYPEVIVQPIRPDYYSLTSPGPWVDDANKLLNLGWFDTYNAPNAGKDLAFTISHLNFNPDG